MAKVLPLDENRHPLLVASSFQTSDATSTPLVSPLTVTDTVVEVKFPKNAVEMHIVHTDQDLQISENPDNLGTFASYVKLPANGYLLLQKAEGGSIWLKRHGGTNAVVSFLFRNIHTI